MARTHIREYFDAISELERTPYGENYKFTDFPNVKMLLQTGRDPVPGFYTYESTFVGNPMPDPLPEIVSKINGESAVAFSLGDAKKVYSHAALIKARRLLCLFCCFCRGAVVLLQKVLVGLEF